MYPAALLVVYCLLTIVGSVIGGWIPLVLRLTHRRMQIAISFVSGMMLGIGLLHLLPHAFHALRSIDRTVIWVLGGFLFMFFLERFFHFHHHDVHDEAVPLADAHALAHPDHGHHDHEGHNHHNHSHGARPSAFSWSGAAIGLTLHSLVDGIAMAAAVNAESDFAGATLPGLGACLAIALHKPFDSLTIGTLLAAAGYTPRFRQALNALYALVTPLGVLLFYLTLGGESEAQHGLGQALGFAAGAFICIATSDLLPELQFHRHDRASLSIALLAGIALAWSTVFLEGAGHDHLTPDSHSEAHDAKLPGHEQADHDHH